MDQKNLPVLDAAELRVLGSLMEKSKTTPDYYPMVKNVGLRILQPVEHKNDEYGNY